MKSSVIFQLTHEWILANQWRFRLCVGVSQNFRYYWWGELTEKIHILFLSRKYSIVNKITKRLMWNLQQTFCSIITWELISCYLLYLKLTILEVVAEIKIGLSIGQICNSWDSVVSMLIRLNLLELAVRELGKRWIMNWVKTSLEQKKISWNIDLFGSNSSS